MPISKALLRTLDLVVGLLVGALALLLVYVLLEPFKFGILVLFVILSPLWIAGLYNAYKRRKQLREQERLRDEWLRVTEPGLRDVRGYPDDWQQRRQEIYRWANGRCGLCEIPVEWNWHIHHKVPISAGGNHEFGNLELLCEDCHIKKHPKQKVLVWNRNLRNLYLGDDSSVRRSRRKWRCALCESDIEAGAEYYGRQRGHKLCSSCHRKRMK